MLALSPAGAPRLSKPSAGPYNPDPSCSQG